MKTKYIQWMALVIMFSLSLMACDKDEDPTPAVVVTPVSPTEGLIKLSESFAEGASTKVEVWAKSDYFTGYNRLYFLLKDSVSGNPVTNATIALNPIMDMGTMMHSTPFENPEYTTNADGKFACAVVYIMSSSGGSWTLNANITNHMNNKSGVFSVPVTVTNPAISRVKSFVSAATAETLFVAMLAPQTPVVGVNDLEVAVYKRMSMGMAFPADSSMTIQINPQMLSMGHGSPNNVHPVHTGKGHYRGSVNYTMNGDWTIFFSFYQGTDLANNTMFFETLVP